MDFTRVMRRAGRVWTGVDRVELAYIEALIAEDVPVWGLARTPLGYVLLDRAGLIAFHRRLTDAAQTSSLDILSRLQRGMHPAARAALSDARRLAVARYLPRGLAGMLRRHLPRGTAYLNIGHSNLSMRVLSAVRALPEARIAIFVHDVIPLEYPHYQRASTVVAHSEVPAGLPPEGPYFVTVGTIEPRKHHALLLDVWQNLGPKAPMLLICGSRGWNNDAVFARLDALGPDARVREVSGLTDGALASLVKRAQGLLFPSHAEGFGLPAIEALQLGTPVMCSNMATFMEILANNAQYIDDSDHKLWEEYVKKWSQRSRDAHQVRDFEAPTWEAHFKVALTLT